VELGESQTYKNERSCEGEYKAVDRHMPLLL